MPIRQRQQDDNTTTTRTIDQFIAFFGFRFDVWAFGAFDEEIIWSLWA